MIKRLGSWLRRLTKSQRFGTGLSEIYDEAFYEHHVDANERASASAVVDTLMKQFAPQSVFDIGCGNGIYLSEFAGRAVLSIGCDGSEHAVRLARSDAVVFRHDLRDVLQLNRRFDLCLCFEVAEHLPARFAPTLVENCARTSDVVVFSSALPGQGGTDHVNEQPFAYWDALFSNEGFGVDRPLTEAILRDFVNRNVVVWLAKNTRIYRRIT